MVAVGCRNRCAVGHHSGGLCEPGQKPWSAQRPRHPARTRGETARSACRGAPHPPGPGDAGPRLPPPHAPVVAWALRTVGGVVTTLREGRAPTPEEVHEAWVARERTEQGVPSTEQITGYRFVQRLLADAVIEQSEALGLDPKIITQAVRLLWEMTDTVTARVLVVQYEAELEMARYDEVQRLEFLRGLLAGTTSPSELHSR